MCDKCDFLIISGSTLTLKCLQPVYQTNSPQITSATGVTSATVLLSCGAADLHADTPDCFFSPLFTDRPTV